MHELENERQSSAVQIEKMETADEPDIVEMPDSDPGELADQWRTHLRWWWRPQGYYA